MKIFVQARPSAKKESIKKISDTHFSISVTQPPIKGKANDAIRNALAVYFKTGTANVKIISGSTSHMKVIEILP